MGLLKSASQNRIKLTHYPPGDVAGDARLGQPNVKSNAWTPGVNFSTIRPLVDAFACRSV
jgi:hypothetical protein